MSRLRFILFFLISVILLYYFFDYIKWIFASWSLNPYYQHGYAVLSTAIVILMFNLIKPKKFEFTFDKVRTMIFISMGIVFFAFGYTFKSSFLNIMSFLLILKCSLEVCFGKDFSKASDFSFIFIALAVPIPYMPEISAFMQLKTTDIAVDLLKISGVNAINQGVHVFVGNSEFIIAEACSGVKSMNVFICIAVVAGYIARINMFNKINMMVLSVIFALMANLIRIMLLFLTANYFGQQTAMKYWHNCYELSFYILSFGFMFVIWKICSIVNLKKHS